MSIATDRKLDSHHTFTAMRSSGSGDGCLAWYADHARDLPWRRSRDPYRVWVSEIMLQQTQVATVRDYFERFVAAFPDVHALAAADEQQVLRLWEGLGYYRRARQLHAAAKQIVGEHGGQFPRDVEALQALPGIGRYTAGAIVSIAFDQRAPILEANTIRLLSRLIAYRDDPLNAAGQRVLWQTAADILPQKNVARFNQALMELGSLVCTPTDPQCDECPLAGDVRGICGRPAAQDPAAEDETAVHRPARSRRHRPPQRPRADARVRRRRALGGPVGFPAIRARSRGTALRQRRNRRQSSRANRHHMLARRPCSKTIKHGVTRYRITLDCYAGRVRRGSLADWRGGSRSRNWPIYR